MPGPGEYPLPSTLANNSIYIGAKLDSFAVRRGSRDVPGPGLYSLKQTEVNNTGKYVLSNYVYRWCYVVTRYRHLFATKLLTLIARIKSYVDSATSDPAHVLTRPCR